MDDNKDSKGSGPKTAAVVPDGGDRSRRSPTQPAKRTEAVQLIRLLRSLEKKPCLYVITSPSGGSAIDLHFGAKTARSAPLDLPGLTAVQRHYEGETSVYATCAWRLESRTEIICGCWDDSGPDGQMRQGLDRIVGKRIRRAVAQPPSWDLTLELDDGLLLRLFCDQTNDDDGADNYAVFTADEVFTVATLSDLFVEPRTPNDD